MLLFQSEEHVDQWLARWNQRRGEGLSGEQIWGLAQAWYNEDRREPAWRRRTKEEAEAIFERLGLTSSFWKL